MNGDAATSFIVMFVLVVLGVVVGFSSELVCGVMMARIQIMTERL